MEDLRNKKIFITGGTGFIGKTLHQELINLGAFVCILSRYTKNSSIENTVFISSISQLSSFAPEIIINLSGESISQRWTSKAKKRIFESRIDVTKSIINYIKTAKVKPSILISASAIGYYGTHQTLEFDELTSPIITKETFSQSLCQKWEKEALEANLYGVRTILLRIGPVLEKDGGMLKKLLLPFKLGIGGVFANGNQWLSWIDRTDLIRLIIYGIMTPSLEGPVNAVAPNPITNVTFCHQLAHILHRPCFLKYPGFILSLLLGEMAEEIMINGQKIFPKKAVQSGFEYLYPTLTSSLQKILS